MVPPPQPRLRLPPIRFTADTIHVLEDAGGRPLEDIRSPDDNRRAADGITGIIREFTADPDCALHVSIAGGRKTMGFFLGYALSLYGRPQDKLSHVLVSEPFESSGGFYYPTPTSRVLEMPGGRLVDTASAQVTLAELPFVSLRHGLPEALLTGHASYNETVEAARQALAPPNCRSTSPRAACAPPARSSRCPRPNSRCSASLPGAHCAAKRRCRRHRRNCRTPNGRQRYLVELRWIDGPLGDLDETERALRRAWTAATSRPTCRSSRRSCSANSAPPPNPT
jgi:hypothetical protein